ncbi:MAG TPA: hypothetical protein VMX14_10555, partial [Anaerolineae bacterium]|nr:hypothetical protein [Anaerolineae bacterium]
MLIDCHVHSVGDEDPTETIKSMDAAELDRIILFGPKPGGWEGDSESLSMREANEWLARFAAEAPDRIIPFTWIEPNLPGAVE